MDYKTIIKLEGKCVDDIMRLPCVRTCEKTAFPGIMLFRLYPLSMAHPNPFLKALTGDTLAEDYDGKWHILRNEKEL